MNLLINIDVDDLERAVGFYTAAFALRPGRRFGADGVELLGAAVPLYLLVKAAGTRACCQADVARDYARHWTPVHLDIVVDDIAAAVDRALQAGASLDDGIRTTAWGRIAMLVDPFGHGFCLIEFVGAGYDAIADS